MIQILQKNRYWIAIFGALVVALAFVVNFGLASQLPISNQNSAINTINNSLNWAGYVATGGTFSAVSSTWTVPQVANSSNNYVSADAAWVGIGGINSQDLIQAGTQAITDGSGQVAYQAWFERLPGSSRPIPLAINPGDSVTISIAQKSSNQWNISFKNNTNNQNYQITTTYASSLSSAEWVEEMPSSNFGFIPLDNFGSIKFTDGYTTKNSVQVTLAKAGAQPITMITYNRQALATPSTLASNGTDFTVARSNVTSAPSIAFLFGRRGFSRGRG